MHRCASHRIDVDDIGLPVDDETIDERLRRLVSWQGGGAADASFVANVARCLQKADIEKLSAWRAAFLGRYMRCSPSEIERMPLSRVQALIEAVSDLLRAEAPKKPNVAEKIAFDAEQNFT